MNDGQRQVELAETALGMHGGSRREAKLWVASQVGVYDPEFIAGAQRWVERLCDHSHYCRVFKQVLGDSPRAFRERAHRARKAPIRVALLAPPDVGRPQVPYA